MAQPKNVKGRTFSWSFSAWEGFGLCPRQYAAKSFYYEVKFQETVHTQWGNRVHKAAELFLQSKQNGDEEALKVVEPYATAMLRAGLRVEAELEISFSRDFKVVPWFSDECWLRVKIDVVLMNFARTEAKLYDWKTGKLKEGDDQLCISAAALSVFRPDLELFDGKYVWLKTGDMTPMRQLKKSDMPGVWERFLPRVEQMERAWETETFPEKPNGLCKNWCQVLSCPFNGRK